MRDILLFHNCFSFVWRPVWVVIKQAIKGVHFRQLEDSHDIIKGIDIFLAKHLTRKLFAWNVREWDAQTVDNSKYPVFLVKIPNC
jgi:hypothetical protein